jgi:type VI secretion system protein ImpH
MGTPGLQGRLEFADSALVSYCGLIAQRPHSAVTLAGLLRDYFRVPIEIDQFVGKWCPLEHDELPYLNAGASSSQLGSGAIAGDQVWNPQARFRIRIGPLTWERFNSFLPDAPAFRELVALARYFANQAMDFEVQSILLAHEVPWCQVSDDPQSPRLGLSSWLKTETFREPAADLVLRVRSSAAA